MQLIFLFIFHGFRRQVLQFENKYGKFVEYPTNVENLVQSYTTQDAQFDEVKENEVRRKMNIWLENNYKSNYKI